MNELGMTVAWLTIQVTLLGLPSLALHALATRRGPTTRFSEWPTPISRPTRLAGCGKGRRKPTARRAP